MPVRHILSDKGRFVITAGPGDTVESVARKLSENRIGAIVVLDAGSRIVGIISERDIVRIIAVEGVSALTKHVSAVMTKSVKTCSEADGEKELMTLMTRNRIRHLPVVNGDQLVGMISIGDVVKFRIDTIEREAEDMKNYIASAG
jgi:CBS domain-containing protein